MQNMKISALNSRTFYYFTAVGAWLSGLAVFAYFASTINNFPGEVAVAMWMQSWRTPWLDTVMRGISFAGIFVVASILLAVVAIALFARGWRKESLLLIAATGVSRGVIGLTQELVARPRPAVGEVQDMRRVLCLSASPPRGGGKSGGPRGG